MTAYTVSADRGNWEDTGCVESPRCQACPLPQCRYDDPVAYQRLVTQRRRLLIVEAVQVEGLTPEQAAERFGVVMRTVFRALARMRK